MGFRWMGLAAVAMLWAIAGISLVACAPSEGSDTGAPVRPTPGSAVAKAATPRATLTLQVSLVVTSTRTLPSTHVTTPSPSANTEMSVETTENENRVWHQDYFRDRPASVALVEGRVRILGGMNFVIPAGEARVLSVGDQLVWPDDHGQTTYTILRITSDGVEVAYVSEFDHGAFGKNLRSVDRGSFWVRYKPQ
jgi:hypothetical protein